MRLGMEGGFVQGYFLSDEPVDICKYCAKAIEYDENINLEAIEIKHPPYNANKDVCENCGKQLGEGDE